ncbi:hypothetical protein V6Z11_D07G065800 [Gossypium hirsutum]
MVSIRGFSFALVFVLVLIGNSTAHRHVMETTVAADHGSGVESATENLANSGKVKLMKLKKVRVEEGANISGSNHHFINHTSSEEAILNVNRKSRNTNHHHHHNRRRRRRRHGKTKMTGFTALNADYHVPKSHPPKNN